jgi:competence protein ComEC
VDRQELLNSLRNLPLLWASLAFLAGILFASALTVTLWPWLLFAAAVLLIVLPARGKVSWQYTLSLIALIAACLGAARYASVQLELDGGDLAFYNDREDWVHLRGIISKPPALRDGYIELILRADEISWDGARWQEVAGTLLARVQPGAIWQYGDEIIVRGYLLTPADYEDFSYKDYLARRNVHSIILNAEAELVGHGQGNWFWSTLYGLRDRSLDLIYRIYPDPEASLLAGILLGEEHGISESLKTAFNDTGTRHIIAISGFNISIIAAFLLTSFRRVLSLRGAAILTALGVILYTLLVGADASVVRAAIMALVAILAGQVGRQQFALNTLAFGAALMTLFNPLLLWDVGFQLSFAATLGLVLYADRLKQRADAWLEKRVSKTWAERLRNPLYDFVLLTLAAQITVLPLLLYHFQRFSVLALPANILVLPVQPGIMILGAASVAFGLLWQPLGMLLAFLAWPLAAYTIRVVEVIAQLPWAAVTVAPIPLSIVVLLYGLLFALTIPALRRQIPSPRLSPVFALVALTALAFWAWSTVAAAPNGRLQITLLDVQGEAILIRTPGGRNLLINGGSSATELSSQLGRHLPFLSRDLDWLLIAGQREEQIAALPLSMQRLAPAAFARVSNMQQTADIDALNSYAEEFQIPQNDLLVGQRLELEDGAFLEVLASGPRGAVLLIQWQDFRALLPLGLDFDSLEALHDGLAVGRVELLLLADAGYAPLNSPEWLAQLDPAVIWLAGNAADLELVTQAALGSRTVFDTGSNGWLRVSTDGHTMWLQSQR